MSKHLLSRGKFLSLICILLSLFITLSCALHTNAAATLSANATVNGNTVTVTVTFPNVSFKAGTIEVSFNKAHLQLASKGTTSGLSHAMITATEVADANAGGFCRFAIMDFTSPVSANGGTLTMIFSVADASVSSTNITVTVIDCGNGPNDSVELAGTTKAVTLKQSTSTDTSSGSGSSSGGQSSGSQSSGSQSSGTTNTGSGSSGTSDTPSVNSSSSKPTSSAKPSSNPVSSNPETSDTGTETDTQITDTESGFEISQTETDAGTGTEGAPPVTDTNDAPSGTTTGISASADTSTQKPKGGLDLSTSAIAIISLSVAAFICCLLTLAGFLRHKKD